MLPPLGTGSLRPAHVGRRRCRDSRWLRPQKAEEIRPPPQNQNTPPSYFNHMKTRVITGIAIIIPAFCLAGWSPEWLFMAVMILLVERCLYEYFSVVRQAGFKPLATAGYVAAAALCGLQWAALYYSQRVEFESLVFLMILIPILALWMTPDLKEYLGSVTSTFFGVLYVAFGFSCLFSLRFSDLGAGLADGRQIVFFLFVIIISGDIFAYFAGRAWGHRLMFPRVSPKKTLEGALGGLAASMIFGWAYARWLWHTSNWQIVLSLALLVAVAGQAGDLVESAIKRGANLKDSAALLPGHGGLLDRMDSLLLGALTLWLALMLGSLIHS